MTQAKRKQAPTVNEFYKWWIVARYVRHEFGRTSHSPRSNHAQTIEVIWDSHIKDAIGHKHFDAVTIKDISAIVRHVQDTPTRKGKPASPKWIRYVFDTVKQIFEDATVQGYEGWRLTTALPWASLVLPRIVDKPVEALVGDEVPRLVMALTAMSKPPCGPLVVALALGLRAQEARLLEWSQLEIDPRRFSPAAGVIHYHAWDRKERVEFDMPFPQELLRFIPKRKGDDPRVFPNISHAQMDYCLKQACLFAGIKKHITIHSLRHSAAQSMHRAGVPIEDIRAQLNHTRIETTMKYLRGAHTLEAKTTIAVDLAQRALMGV